MIFEKLRVLMAEQLGIDKERIEMDSTFEEDLGIDSVDVVELTMSLEEEFGIDEMTEDEIASIKTISDLVGYLQNKLDM